MSRYFVAGGAGFIGSHMVQQAAPKAGLPRSWFTTISAPGGHGTCPTIRD